jgi:hypothetical protein
MLIVPAPLDAGSDRRILPLLSTEFQEERTMRTSNPMAFILAAFCLPCFLNGQQSAAPVASQPANSETAPPTTSANATERSASTATALPPTASGLLEPALDLIQGTIAGLNLDKWKKGNVREEASTNIKAILKDVQTTLQPLLKTADAAPDAVVALLPVSRNINALYNVLLRVEEAARVAGPGDQAEQLQQALIKLGDARRAIEDRIEAAALAQEKQLADLRSTVKAQANFKCPAAAPAPSCTAPAPAKTKKKRSPSSKGTTAKPSTTPPATTPATGK